MVHNVFTDFGTSAESPDFLHAMGLEKASVRFPLDSSEGHAISARKALLEEATAIIKTTGGRLALETASAVCAHYCALTYQQRVAARADISTACDALDGLMSQLAGFVVSWCEGSNIKSTTVAAKSIQRLKTSHQQQWSIGAAQGKTSWRAFRAHGTAAVIPADITMPVLVDPAATGAIVAVAQALVAARPVGFTVRAPATEERVEALKREHETQSRRHETLALMAMTTGQPAPAPPAALDLSAAF